MSQANKQISTEFFKLPGSALAQEIHDLVRDCSPTYLFNHCLRTFVFARFLGEQDGISYDPEILYYATLMHDLGLTKDHRGKSRFEVDGADAAYQILVKRGASAAVAQTVWDAVALHAIPHIPSRKGGEIALVYAGAGVDVLGLRIKDIPLAAVKHALEEYPRENFKQGIINDMVDYLKQNPTGGAGYWLAEVGETHLNLPHFSFEKLLLAAPFNE